ncbi:hypothetical protein PVL29_009091 [Vitis rotundifolia]|uniref:Uncharacterized protein n=1 Tax=Vitis rotundifolia TaxID=103349 RepID=A0AA39DTQ1_VITRO|nr:hypothetical protein PVL29_009091 [Vitis rotundifolia]
MNTQGDSFIAKITGTNGQNQEQHREKGKCDSVEAEPISRQIRFLGRKVLVVTNVFDDGKGKGEALGELDVVDDGEGDEEVEGDMRLMAPRMKRVAAVERPAITIWGRERKGLEMATAAMDFMGWTGIGVPKRKPVEIL